MAKTQETNISVSNGQVEVTVGRAQARIPVGQLDQMIRVLTATRSFVAGTTSAPPMAEAEPAAAPAEPKRSSRGASKSKSKSTTSSRGGSKRRSRKRVGDALVTWMEDNPGWHTEADLERAVEDNHMTDANPRRALKIALGKQRGDTFESDDKGHWKLISDKSAGPPPAKKAARPKKSSSKSSKKAAKDSKSGAVLVKKGQGRKKAAASEDDPKKDKRSTRNRRRWQRASNDEVERARRNLLGLGPAAAGE